MVADGFPLNAKLSRILHHVDACCLFCNDNKPEISTHLFVECPFTRVVWFDLHMKCPALNNGFVNWFKSCFTDQWQTYTKAFSVICWHIWKYRNSVLFDKIKPNPIDCIQLIKQSFIEWDIDVMMSSTKQQNGCSQIS